MILSSIQTSLIAFVRHSCYRASIGTIKRPIYARLYPVVLVKPDGSAINIKYREPISVMRLPFDINTLSEVEKKRRLLKRQMLSKSDSKKTNEKEKNVDKDIKFDPKKYLNFNKKPL